MKHAITGAAVALLLGSVATAALATSNGGSSSANASSTVSIIRPIAVSHNSDLQFGTLVAPTSGSGTATVSSSDGTIGYSGLDHASGSTGRADFSVDGEAGVPFSLTVPTSVTMTGPGADIVVTTSTNVTGGTGTHNQTLLGTFPAQGTTLDVGVGGQITIPSGQVSGAYSGTMTVTATYN